MREDLKLPFFHFFFLFALFYHCFHLFSIDHSYIVLIYRRSGQFLPFLEFADQIGLGNEAKKGKQTSHVPLLRLVFESDLAGKF